MKEETPPFIVSKKVAKIAIKNAHSRLDATPEHIPWPWDRYNYELVRQHLGYRFLSMLSAFAARLQLKGHKDGEKFLLAEATDGFIPELRSDIAISFGLYANRNYTKLLKLIYQEFLTYLKVVGKIRAGSRAILSQLDGIIEMELKIPPRDNLGEKATAISIPIPIH